MQMGIIFPLGAPCRWGLFFLEEHHADGDYFFWPNFARCQWNRGSLWQAWNSFYTPWIKPPYLSSTSPNPEVLGNSESQGIWWRMGGQDIVKKTLMEIDISLWQNLFATLKAKIRIAANKGVPAVMWLAEINQDIKLMI